MGRPNVGKSALFNRLAGRRMALVQNTPDGHVTRDWREAPASLADLRFTVVDTSGMEPELGARAPRSIQARAAALTAGVLARADVTLLLMDGRAGVLPGDVELARWLRRLPPPHRVLLVANKCERRETSAAGLAESPRLGFGPAVAVAAEAGEGMADLYAGLQPLLDAVRGAAWGVVGSAGGPGVGGAEGAGVGGAEGAGVRGAEGADVDSAEGAGMGGAEGAGVGGARGSGPPGLAAEGMQAPDDAAPAAEGGDAAAERTTERDSATKAQSPGSQASPLLRMAVVGLPNVGKSTLCNALLASERCLTGPEPGLTRDAVTARFSHEVCVGGRGGKGGIGWAIPNPVGPTHHWMMARGWVCGALEDAERGASHQPDAVSSQHCPQPPPPPPPTPGSNPGAGGHGGVGAAHAPRRA